MSNVGNFNGRGYLSDNVYIHETQVNDTYIYRKDKFHVSQLAFQKNMTIWRHDEQEIKIWY